MVTKTTSETYRKKELLTYHEDNIYKRLLNYRKWVIQEYNQFFNRNEAIPKTKKYSILNSFIHMHCNRLGFLLEGEERAWFYAFKTIESQMAIEEHS